MALKSGIFTAFCLALAIPGAAKADTVVLGSDYLQTLPGTYFNFGGAIGVVDFTGYAFGPGNTDTIMQRTSDITINGGPGTLQLTALSLASTAPVPQLGGTVYISLDPNNLANDTGQITIGGTKAGGTFSSFFDVFFDVCTAPGSNGVGCGGGALIASGNLQLSNAGANWTSTPSGVIVSGPVGDQSANLHTGLGANEADFWPAPIIESHPGGFGAHVVSPAVPEPSTWIMMLLGFAGLGFASHRRTRKSKAPCSV
jgi:hypothetical protein